MSTGNIVTPTSTIVQARIMLYQPSQRPKTRQGDWLETPFGRCRVTGRLGQRHADVVEGILYCAERLRKIPDGGVELLVDPARLRKSLSDSRYSMSQLQKLMTELRAATIEIETPQLKKCEEKIIGGLIDHVKPSPMTRPDPLTGGLRHLWRIRLGVALVMLLDHDLRLYYNPAPIARLQHGISQAVARHILSHKNEPSGGWKQDTLIRAVAGEVSSQSMRDARRRLKQDESGLQEIGVVIQNGRVMRGTTAREGGTTARRCGALA